MFGALAHLANRRHWLVLAVAVVAGAAAGALGGSVSSVLKGGGFWDPKAESALATAQIAAARHVSTDSIVVLVHPGTAVTSGPGLTAVQSALRTLRDDPAVATVTDYPDTHDPALVARDGLSTYMVGEFAAGSDSGKAVARLQAAFASDPDVTLGGGVLAQAQVQDQVSRDLAHAEMIAFPILFVLLLVVFRGVVAALLPLLVGGLSIITTFLGLRITTGFTDLSIFALNLVTGLGLGLAIDYSLLMVSRFREELARNGGERGAAIRTTMATAGRTVLFSSLTVAAACAALLVFPQRFLYSMGIGGVLGTLVSAAVALLVLPAMLAALGPRVDMLSLRRRAADPSARGRWYRIATMVMRRPIAITVVTVTLLGALGLPFLGIRFTSVDAGVLPESASARQVDDALHQGFDPHRISPVQIAVSAPANASGAVTAYAQRVATVAGVAAVAPPRYLGGDTWQVSAELGSDPLSDASRDAVVGIRGLQSSYPVGVGGQTAQFVDLQTSLAQHLPLTLLIIAASTFLVLFAATGSVVLPVKSLVMNLASISATFGLLVLVFQDGRFESLLGYTSQGALESTQPILLVAIAFGLSTDYGVFLLTRIKEAHDSGMGTREAVAHGLARTGRIVTAAALCFTVAIGAFATSQIVFIKELGLGTAAAVLIDASIVRALLVPSLMALLGDWNWWAPRPLRRLHHRLRLDRVELAGVAQPAPLAERVSA